MLGGLASWNRGWPLDAVDRYPEYLAAVTLADVDAHMRACAGNLVLSLVGNETIIRAALAGRYIRAHD